MKETSQFNLLEALKLDKSFSAKKTSTRHYTGVGSRETPEKVLSEIQTIAKYLDSIGFVLRSGAAPGADKAFETGAKDKNKEIYIPWNGFEGKWEKEPGIYLRINEEAEKIASQLHPKWDLLSQGARKLMTRNVFQVLGLDMKQPSAFVVCWTKDGCESRSARTRETGGTGLAVALADLHNIPVFNLKNPDAKERLKFLLSEFKNKD